jgi:hypothetical protein
MYALNDDNGTPLIETIRDRPWTTINEFGKFGEVLVVSRYDWDNLLRNVRMNKIIWDIKDKVEEYNE